MFKIGDVVLIKEDGWGFCAEDIDKYVEVLGFGDYYGDDGVKVRAYQDCDLYTQREAGGLGCNGFVGIESFGENPMILLNTKDELVLEEHPLECYPEKDNSNKDMPEKDSDGYAVDHYNNFYKLTEKDIEAGEIKVDAYWVAKQWKTGSRDDSGALWHSLKTIARFGDKNCKAREIKALYNQAIALARIYEVDLNE